MMPKNGAALSVSPHGKVTVPATRSIAIWMQRASGNWSGSAPIPVAKRFHPQSCASFMSNTSTMSSSRHRAFDRDRAGEEVRSFAGRHACEHIAMLRQDAKA
jgi:hypothetical protein